MIAISRNLLLPLFFSINIKFLPCIVTLGALINDINSSNKKVRWPNYLYAYISSKISIVQGGKTIFLVRFLYLYEVVVGL